MTALAAGQRPDAGRHPPCRWCGRPIRLVHTGAGWSWMHAGDAFPCRGPGGMFVSTHAEPTTAYAITR